VDIRNAKVEPTVEHGGTCYTYFMFPKESYRKETMGSYLEYIAEFEIPAGERLEPHTHDTHEFYYILSGRAKVEIDGEQRDVAPRDLIHIGREQVHSIWPVGDEPLRALAFASSFMPEGSAYKVAHGTPGVSGDVVPG
jgi:mannose-6-phosphate isomerase-like protein (cupin superfamily)